MARFQSSDATRTRHVTGQGRFTEDLMPVGAARMVVMRAPVAHGQVRALDLGAARTCPGVLDVIGPSDLAAEGVGCLAAQKVLPGMAEPHRPVLADDKVVYVGQPVAAVIAQTQTQAEDAAEAIALDIDELPAVVGADDARGGLVWDQIPGNVAFVAEKGEPAATKAAFRDADHVVSVRLEHPRIAPAPIETRTCIASAQGARLSLITPSQGVVGLRRQLAACIGMAEHDLAVRTPDVGGSFAVKIWPYPEHVLALIAARRTGRDIAWVSTRGESLAADVAGRARIDEGELAFDSDGRFRAFRIRALADMGAFINSNAADIVTAGAVRPLNQCYDIPAMHYAVTGKFSNAAPTDAYRGAGKPESTATLERLIDLAAAKLDRDPLELREANLIRPDAIPYSTSVGETYDSGDFPAIAEALRAQVGDGYAVRRAAARAAGRCLGQATGFFLHATGGSPAERSSMRATTEGRVEVVTGVQDSGQGHAESLAAVVADTLELDIGVVDVVQGDGTRLDRGGGTGGSNLLAIAGNNLHRTALDLIEAGRVLAADRLEVAKADIVYGQGAFSIAGTDRSLSLYDLGPDKDTSCEAAHDFDGERTTFPNGGLRVELSVDRDTGAPRLERADVVVDLGVIVNRDLAYAQLHGALAQAWGEVFCEALVFDPSGQLLSGSLMDYALPRADDLPMLTVSDRPTRSPNSALAVKGVGELLSIGAPAVLMNAVHDAVGLRTETLQKPLTAERIWQAASAG